MIYPVLLPEISEYPKNYNSNLDNWETEIEQVFIIVVYGMHILVQVIQWLFDLDSHICYYCVRALAPVCTCSLANEP